MKLEEKSVNIASNIVWFSRVRRFVSDVAEIEQKATDNQRSNKQELERVFEHNKNQELEHLNQKRWKSNREQQDINGIAKQLCEHWREHNNI